MNKGIIVSIQNYSKTVTNELAKRAVLGGAVGIRTDQPIKSKVTIIGLLKLDHKKYYMTTDIEAIKFVNKYTNLIAIDSRKGNQDIELLYGYCHINQIDIVADIENIQDVCQLLQMLKDKKIMMPKYIATTFSKCNIDLIKEIYDITTIPVIAEGGYHKKEDIREAKKNGAYAICIGEAISKIERLTLKYNYIFQG